MKRLVAALPLALAAAALAAPAVSSASGTVVHPAKQQLKIQHHHGQCPFAAQAADV